MMEDCFFCKNGFIVKGRCSFCFTSREENDRIAATNRAFDQLLSEVDPYGDDNMCVGDLRQLAWTTSPCLDSESARIQERFHEIRREELEDV